jgi:hypothetical protein
MDYGKDSYTTVNAVQTYLDRTLTSNEQAILAYVIPAASRWIDRSLGTNFDNLNNIIPFGTAGSGWTQRKFAGGQNEINITPCQNIILVQAVNPYDFSVWYTYSTPLEYVAEPYNLNVKSSLRLKMNEFTGGDAGLTWPGDEQGIMVTALFTEFDYVANDYPSDIKTLCNHISAIWLQNNQNAEPVQREQVEGHMVIKRIDDLIASDPMVTRVIDSRAQVWLDEM